MELTVVGRLQLSATADDARKEIDTRTSRLLLSTPRDWMRM